MADLLGSHETVADDFISHAFAIKPNELMNALCAVVERYRSDGTVKLTESRGVALKRERLPVNEKDVLVHVIFRKVDDINTVKETFWADIIVQAMWRESKFDGAQNHCLQVVEKRDSWNPCLYVDNVVGEPKVDLISRKILTTSNGEAYICERQRIKGTFTEKFELNSFPFDTQFLITSMSLCTFSITLAKPENRLAVTVTLLLTAMTFKFNVNSYLPRIPYLTYLDKYILIMMTFMCLEGVWHAISPTVNEFWVDKGFLIAFGTCFCVINVVFIIFIALSKRRGILQRQRQDSRLQVQFVNERSELYDESEPRQC